MVLVVWIMVMQKVVIAVHSVGKVMDIPIEETGHLVCKELTVVAQGRTVIM